MPRIRKKTSNRRKLKDRVSIQKKVKETRKKRAKAAKKNPQWKSKTPKDPGIPNDFPYKDEILAEVAEERRLAAEEKAKRKAEKQQARLAAKGEAHDEDEAMDEDAPEEPTSGKNKLDVGAEAIASLAAKTVKGQMKTFEQEQVDVSESEDEEEEAPILINRDLPTFRSVLEAADVILEVLDARDPLETRSEAIEEYASQQSKKVMLVLSKIDTCPREAVSIWLSHLRTQQPATFPFKASSSFIPSPPTQAQPKGKGKLKEPANDVLGGGSILACLGQWAQEKKGDSPLTVAIVGITNVGKSALVNSLVKRSALPVYTQSAASRGPTTTELPQEVTIEANGKSVRFIDTPGISFAHDADEANSDQSRGRDILLRSRGRIDRLKDPSPPLVHLVPRCNHEDLMLLYNLPAFSKGDEVAFLSGVARAHQLVKKKGDLDLAGAARVVLRDWSTGKFARYAVPPAAASSSTGQDASTKDWLKKFYANDELIFTSLPPRKELRKSSGLVRLSAGSIDGRKINLNETWPALDDSEAEDSDGDGMSSGIAIEVGDGAEEDGSEDESEEDDDDEGFEEESDEEEKIEEPPVPSKRKRGIRSQVAAPPAKKVAFAAKAMDPSSSKSRPRVAKEAAAPQPALTSALKKAAKPVHQKTTKVEPPKKVANRAASKVKELQGGDAYDFSKFFR